MKDNMDKHFVISEDEPESEKQITKFLCIRLTPQGKVATLIFLLCFSFLLAGLFTGIYSATYNHHNTRPIVVKHFDHMIKVSDSVESKNIDNNYIPEIRQIYRDLYSIIENFFRPDKRQKREIFNYMDRKPTFLDVIAKSTEDHCEKSLNYNNKKSSYISAVINKINRKFHEYLRQANKIKSNKNRIRREIYHENDKSINPVELKYINEEDLIREKRRQENELQDLNVKYLRCKKDAPQQEQQNCENIYETFIQHAQEISKKYADMTKLLQQLDSNLKFNEMNFASKQEKEKMKAQKKLDKKKEDSSEERLIIIPETGEKYMIKFKNKTSKILIPYHQHSTDTPIETVSHHTIHEQPKEKNPFVLPKPLEEKIEIIEDNDNIHQHIFTTQSTEIHPIPTPKLILNNKFVIDNHATTTDIPLHPKIKEINIPAKNIPPEHETIVRKGQANLPENFDDIKPIPRIHEDLTDEVSNTRWFIGHQMTPAEFLKLKAKNQQLGNEATPAGVDQQQSIIQINENTPVKPLNVPSKNIKDLEVIGASGPFLTLCEQLARQNANDLQHLNKAQALNSPGSAFGNAPHFQTVQHQFTSKGPHQTPVTGESMKASAQVMFNPGLSYMPYPVCFMVAPTNQQFRSNSQGWNSGNNILGLTANNLGGYALIPLNNVGNFDNNHNVHPSGLGFMKTPVTNQGFVTNPAGRMTGNQPYFCSYLPSVAPNFGYVPVADFRNANDNVGKGKTSDGNQFPSTSDIIYASYANRLFSIDNETMGNAHNYCANGTVPCFGTNQCISRGKWCDSKVDCLDASDETSCSCISRLAKHKICDGYPDCPMGSDEMGCFGCDEFAYSCYSNKDEYEKSKRSSLSMCYTIVEKCDGFESCLNGRDEKDCSMIVRDLGHHLSYTVSYMEGILHRNYKGKWYPACENALTWAQEACESEMGDLHEDPELSLKPGIMNFGPFINNPLNPNQIEPIFVDTCPSKDTNDKPNHSILYVKCPKFYCGMNMIKKNKNTLQLRIRSSGEKILVKRDESEEVRIVGGDEVKPMEWPYIVAMYRNGKFHCGGAIINELWIITAAHCVDKYTQHYYEIRAGLLRRLSFSPMVQTVKVKYIIVHNNYDRAAMQNDLALMRLDNPLNYNKWVRPICMPGIKRSSMNDDWIWGPRNGTMCTVVGWGAIKEKGNDPDHLHAVEIPIIARCKHLRDRIGEEICAGELEGGRDACQGDSGGPLFCRFVSDPNRYYLAGIVSHGEGCARPDEPGVYTRVALFLDWIKESVEEKLIPHDRPVQNCPGKICVWGGGKCIPGQNVCDKVVDCLGGEDEINCKISEDVGNIQSTFVDMLHAVEKHLDLAPLKNNSKEIINDTEHKLKPSNVEFKHTEFKLPDNPQNDDTVHILKTEQNNKHENIFENHASNNEVKPIFHHEEHNDESNNKHTSVQKDNPRRFKCTKIEQIINAELQCNKEPDCEDGTDELDCSCHDVLIRKNRHLICDGNVDCADMSDENNCLHCKEDEFACRLSRKCIPKHLVCDDQINCAMKEDELDCLALTDGYKLYMDANNRPVLKHEGIVLKNSKGKWNPLCSDDFDIHKKFANETASQVCSLLGFSGSNFFNTTQILNTSLTIIDYKPEKNIREFRASSTDENEENIEEINNIPDINNCLDFVLSTKHCMALYVECIPHTKSSKSSSPSHHPQQNDTKTEKNKIINTLTKNPIPLHPVIQKNKQPTVVAHSNHSTKLLYEEKLFNEIDEHFLLWNVKIYLDGSFQCNGMLVDKYWILVEMSCVRLVNMNIDYLTAFLGGGKGSHSEPGPNEQIIRIDCMQYVDNSNVALLHTERQIIFTRYVISAYVPEQNHDNHYNYAHEECRAISYNKDYRGQSLDLLMPNMDCGPNLLCYMAKYDIDCDVFETRTGIVMCKSSAGLWYPNGFFSDRRGLCAFKNVFKLLPLRKFYEEIYSIIASPKCKHEPSSVPHCKGHRCPFGKCLESYSVCDGKIDCRDGSDENKILCKDIKEKGCQADELKCANGKCISKLKFCDHVNDCGDLTDEPFECSCYTYLSVTDPKKICDGMKNCHDSSDENPKMCKCLPHTYQCGDTHECVPMDNVCDGVANCPHGEDEMYCNGIHHYNKNNDGYGQFIIQTNGIWHTKCFPKSSPPNEQDIVNLCLALGYKNLNGSPKFRLMDEIANEKRSSNDQNLNETIFSNPTKVESIHKFSPVKIGKGFNLFIKPSYPESKLVYWDKTDKENCYWMNIKCY